MEQHKYVVRLEKTKDFMSRVQNKSVKDVSRLLFHESRKNTYSGHKTKPKLSSYNSQKHFWHRFIWIYLIHVQRHFISAMKHNRDLFFLLLLLNESNCEETVWAKLAGNAVFILSK